MIQIPKKQVVEEKNNEFLKKNFIYHFFLFELV
jgi:hypothetical protein